MKERNWHKKLSKVFNEWFSTFDIKETHFLMMEKANTQRQEDFMINLRKEAQKSNALDGKNEIYFWKTCLKINTFNLKRNFNKSSF